MTDTKAIEALAQTLSFCKSNLDPYALLSDLANQGYTITPINAVAPPPTDEKQTLGCANLWEALWFLQRVGDNQVCFDPDDWSDVGYASALETIEAALAELEQRRNGSQVAQATPVWQPIETAPRDGFFLVYEDGAVRTMMRHKGVFAHPAVPVIVGEHGDKICGDSARHITGGRKLAISDCIYSPSHWMPLPPPPATEKENG